MTLSFIVLDPTSKFICSDVHPGFFAFRSLFMKFSYCLDTMLSFFSREFGRTSDVRLNSMRYHVSFFCGVL